MAPNQDFDPWVLDWISDEKSKGRKCFDVKKSGNSYYVYYQTTRYNSNTKKREKVSGYIGKLSEGIGLIESGGSSAYQKEEVKEIRYGLGVDTGGTFTDAVLMDLDDNIVLVKKKSPTIHNDLSIGLYSSIKSIFAASDVKPSEISLVGISTTLATNSILEGAGGEVGLIMIGWDPMDPVNFGEMHQIFVKGGYDSKGKALAPLDEDEIRSAIEVVSKDVDAIAISGLFSVVNSSQEERVKEMAKEMTGLPTVAGYELSASLGVDVRTETTVLNAKLIPVVSKFFNNVECTLREMGISAPIMAYKGDGSVMDLNIAKMYPVETILSGPAASAVGGTMISKIQDCVIVDIGGTSTDIAFMEEGFPMIQEEGATVGKWRTRVKAVDMHTVALGGDSKIVFKDFKFKIGPDRVTPLSTLAQKFPKIVDKILHDDLTDYYVVESGADTSKMTDREKRVYRAAEGKGPMTSMEIMDSTDGLWVIDDELKSLTSKNAMESSNLTPTDVMVFMDRFDSGNKKGAEAGIHAISEKLGMTDMQAATLIFDEIKAKVSEAIMVKMLDDEIGNWQDENSMKLIKKMISLSRGKPLDMIPTLKYPIIGVGAPAAVMMEDLHLRLKTDVSFPENYDVCNAIGAVTSKITDSLTAVVTPTSDFRFSASIPFVGMVYYDHLDSAISSANRSLTAMLIEKVKRSGGINIQSKDKVKVIWAAEGAHGEWEDKVIGRSLNFAEVTVRVIGDPPTQ